MHARRLALHVPTDANRAYALNLVRTYDNENFIANLLQRDKRARRAHAALRAFNVELDRVRVNVSNEDLAKLRLAYFRDAIEPLLAPGAPVASGLPPVVDCLAEAVTAFPEADFRPLVNLVAARTNYLAYPAFKTVPQLEAFAAAPHAALIAVHASVLLNAPLPRPVAAAVAAAGPAVGLAIVLRGVPYHAAQRQSYMPRTADIAPSHLLTANGSSLPLFRAVARVANQRLNAAEKAVRELDERAVRPAFWPLVMAQMYLGRLAKAKNDPFDERLNIGLRTTWEIALQLRLLQARLFGR